MKTFLIIDSHALIHRGFHALPPLNTKSGEPVNAVYGFYSILLKALKDIRPDYIAAAFDLPQKTFRHEEFSDYKIQRPKAPDELVSQIIKVKEIIPEFNIQTYEKPRYEADDIVGTIAKKLSDFDGRVLILTGDLDTLQLVDDKVNIVTLKKGISETLVYDKKEIFSRWGLVPEQLIDFKALKGDPSDNIPGVRGIGEKTAAGLLQEFHDLENIYKEAEKEKGSKIKESVIKKLLDNKEQAFFSRKLSEIKRDVDIDFDREKCSVKNIDPKKIADIFKKYEFFSLVSRLKEVFDPQNKEVSTAAKEEEGASPAKEEELPKINFKEVEKEKLLAMYLLAGQKPVVLAGSHKYSVDTNNARQKEDLAGVLQKEGTTKICHDAKNIYKIFGKEASKKINFDFDLMLAGYLIKPGEKDYSLEKILAQETGKNEKETSAEDIFALYKKIKNKLETNGLGHVFYEIEMPLAKILAFMEEDGIGFDKEKLVELNKEVSKKIAAAEKEIYKEAGEEFNINSPKQVSEILFKKMEINTVGVRKTEGGKISTKSSELEKMAKDNKIASQILGYRELVKLKTTYIDVLPLLVKKDGRIHTTFNQCGTATGRMSSQDPNLQNIPVKSAYGNEIRKAFVAKKGYVFLSFDYSQIELRIVASLAGDKKMIQAFLDGHDIHRLTASEVNNVPAEKVTDEMRYQAKALNFGVIYGMGPKGFAESSGLTMKQAQAFIREYFSDFVGIEKYLKETKEKARSSGYVETLFGRKRYLPGMASSNWQERQSAERMAINMPVQGTAADIIKMAMIKIDRLSQGLFGKEEKDRENDLRLILQVHDELVFEVKKENVLPAEEFVKEQMESVTKLKVPLVVNCKKGENLGELF